MPRKTPVKEILSNENVVDSPIRRSSRIAATTSTPTLANQGAKVTTRRSSASSDSSQTAKPTRRMSFSQESKEAETPKRTGRSSSKSPTTLLKEQNLKGTPTVVRTRRASKSGTDDESNQSTASTSSDAARRVTRRNSITEKISPLEKIDETDLPKPQKRLTRRRSSSSEPNPPEKVAENTEEKSTNMETIQENTEEDQEIQKYGQKASEVIDEMKTKSPVVMMERLKRKSVEKKVEIDEKKRKPNDGEENKSEDQDEQKMPLECEVIVEENTLKFSDDNEVLQTDTKSEETEFKEQTTLQKLPKPSITDKEIEEADVEVSNLNLQITLSSEEVEKENLNNSGSSDKENSINIPGKDRGEMHEKSNTLESVSIDVNVLTPCDDNHSKPTTIIPMDVDKIETVASPSDKKRKSLERDVSLSTDKNETCNVTKSKQSVSPANKSSQVDDGEVAKNIKETTTSQSSEDIEKNVLSKQDNNQQGEQDSSMMEVAPQQEEEQEINKANVVKPLTMKPNEEVTEANNENMEENGSVGNKEQKTADDGNESLSGIAVTSDIQDETIEFDKDKVTEISGSKNEEKTKQLLDEKEINPEAEKETMRIELELKTPSKDILKERKNFNDLINDDSESETPQKNTSVVIDSNCEEDSVTELEQNETPVAENTDVETEEPDKSISKETEISGSSKKDDTNQKVDDQSLKEKKQTGEVEQGINEKLCLKKSTEEEQVTDAQNTEHLKEPTNGMETEDKKSNEKVTEKIAKKSDTVDDERNPDDVVKKPQDQLTRNESEDLFEIDAVGNDTISGEQSKPELSKTVAQTEKSKTPKQQTQDDDLLNSVIDENEMADINEFLCQVNSEDSLEKPSSDEKRKSTLRSEEKVAPNKKSENNLQENEEINKSNEKQKSLKTSDDQSENSFREKVNDILKNKALCSDNEEADISTNDFIDDMAEEVEDEETDDEVFEDSNEISCEGESINSSDTESEHEDDTYENDSFIDDEDQNNELLSGNEDFLGDGAAKKKIKKGEKPKQPRIKKDGKKYSRIVSCDASSSDNDNTSFETKNKSKKTNGQETISAIVTKSNDNIVETRPIEVISIEEENEQTPTICVDSDSEDRIIKVDTNDSSTSPASSKRNSIRKSSINIQENISLQDIEDGDLSERITKVVEWFCSGIKTRNEMSGNISLNVSLDYNDEQTEESSKTRKRKSTEPEHEVSPEKVRKTGDAKDSSSDKKQRKPTEPSVSDVNVEIIDENEAITPSKTTMSKTKDEAMVVADSAEENENNDTFSLIKEITILPSPSKKKGLKKALESDEPSLTDVNVEIMEDSDIIMPSKTTTSNEEDKSKKSKLSEEDTEDIDVFSPIKTKEIIPLPSSSNKKKSKKVLESTNNDFDVSIEVVTPTKTKESPTKKSKLIDLQDEQIEVSSPTKIKEASASKRNKSKKTSETANKDFDDVEIFSPTSQKIEVNVSEPTMHSRKKMKKSKDVMIVNEPMTVDEPKVIHAIKEKIPKAVVETSKEKSIKKKKKKLEDVVLQTIEDDIDTNKGKTGKTTDVIKKTRKDSSKMDEAFLVVDKKKTKVKGSNKTGDEISSLANYKKSTEDPIADEFDLNKGKKRAISDSTSWENIGDIEKPIPRKQRKIQGIDVKPTFHFTELKIQHLDDWTNSPAHVTPTLSEIPEENQRKANKKRGKGNTRGKNVLIPSLNMDDSAWETETITQENIGVSKQMKVIKKKRDVQLPTFHPKDFKNQMLHCMGRVERMDTKILLRNRKIV